MGTQGTLRDASTQVAARLGAERSPVQIRPPRLGGSPLRSGLSAFRAPGREPERGAVVPALVPSEGRNAAMISSAGSAPVKAAERKDLYPSIALSTSPAGIGVTPLRCLPDRAIASTVFGVFWGLSGGKGLEPASAQARTDRERGKPLVLAKKPPMQRARMADAVDERSLHATARPSAAGKFIWRGGEKVYVRGATYGTFRRNSFDGTDYPDPPSVAQDFAAMAASGLNAIRTYTVPPRWILDLAVEHRLSVMVGIPWEHHVPFLDDLRRARSIEERVRTGVSACAGHPAVLCYSLANEIRAPIVRWHGPRPVERFLQRLHAAAKSEDPDGLVTYVNYPSTEYLDLPFLDLVCFNVYLESEHTLEAYIARLHNLTGERPLVLAEIGLDSRRNGEEAQSRTVASQVRTAFASGCAGAFVFAWTDEWHMHQHEPEAGFDVADWDFGLTDRERRPKPALRTTAAAFADAPLPVDPAWPRISVLVCTHNGARTLSECLDGLEQLVYPDYEVIVVSDGSTDASVDIVRRRGYRLIQSDHVGLAAARNAGLRAATGDIVAYIDDDARPDPHWLAYLTDSLHHGPWAAVGGPNLAPRGDGWVAESVANAPGGPHHVLVSDREAEHIPGCNMAFRRRALEAIDGFDPIFRAAGDDVDVCWRLRERGFRIGFNPAAVVWHRRRDSLTAYWRQQRGYGEAEALVERKWPERYNGAGHLTWSGRIYRPVAGCRSLLARRRIRYGQWGSALFQSVYERKTGVLSALPSMPDWYLAILALALLTALGALWPPLLLASAILTALVIITLAQAVLGAARAIVPKQARSAIERSKIRAMVAVLHLVQPAARLRGRIRGGLAPWRMRPGGPLRLPRRRQAAVWSESWQNPERRIRNLAKRLEGRGASVLCGGSFDRWDLEVRRGQFGSARLLMAVEEYPHGKQLVRWRYWPRFSLFPLLVAMVCVALAVAAASDDAIAAGAALAVCGAGLLIRTLRDAGAATGTIAHALAATTDSPEPTELVEPQGSKEPDVAEAALR
jgi:O-antigen biosynthesis protein